MNFTNVDFASASNATVSKLLDTMLVDQFRVAGLTTSVICKIFYQPPTSSVLMIVSALQAVVEAIVTLGYVALPAIYGNSSVAVLRGEFAEILLLLLCV